MKKISTFIIKLKEKRREIKFLKEIKYTCSAARGSRFKIRFAASLFFAAIEQANGV